MIKDLTKGPPAFTLWQFSLPMLFSMLFQQCYSLADSFVAGNYIGMDGLASIGVSHPVTVLFLAVASGSSIGVSVVISQLFGAKKIGMVKTSVYTALRMSIVGAVVLTGIGFFICSRLLGLLKTPEDILISARQYLWIYIAGIPFLFFYNLANGVFQALGDSKTPLYFLIFSSLLNIVLDIILVVIFHAGIAGIGFATFFSQGMAGGFATVVMLRRIKELEEEEAFFYYNQDIFIQIMKISIPSILQQSFVSLGQMSIQGVINGYGSAVVAGYSAAFKLNTLIIMTFNTICNAVSSFVAQNAGAKNWERVQEGVRAAVKMILCIALFVVAGLLIGRWYWISLFLKNDKEAILAGVRFLEIVAPFYFLVCFKIVADGALRGLGAMKEFMIGTFADLIMRVVFSIILSRYFGYEGIWWVWPLAWMVGTIFSVLFYRRKKNQMVKNI